MNTSKLVFYDWETCSLNVPNSEPCELAAVIIDPRNLEIIDEFSSTLKPVEWEEPFISKDTVAFHAKRDNLTSEQVIELWKTYPNQKEVWENFYNFLLKHNENPGRPTVWGQPICIGHNNLRFDNLISDRLAEKYGMVDKDGKSKVFNKKSELDLRHILWLMFENRNDLNSFSFDVLREYFGMDKEGAHTAIFDVKQGAELFIRLLRFVRRFSETAKFRGAFKNVQV